MQLKKKSPEVSPVPYTTPLKGVVGAVAVVEEEEEAAEGDPLEEAPLQSTFLKSPFHFTQMPRPMEMGRDCSTVTECAQTTLFTKSSNTYTSIAM